MPSSLHGQKGVECAGMAKHVEMRECWWRHLSGGRLVEGSNAHIATIYVLIAYGIALGFTRIDATFDGFGDEKAVEH